MSRSVNAYAVDLNRLRATYGRGDAALLARLEAVQSARLRADAEPIEVWMHGTDAPSQETLLPRPLALRTALRDLIHGTVSATAEGSSYGYALEMLCAYLGTRLPGAHLEVLQAGGIGEVEAMAGLGDLLVRSAPPLPIPSSPDVRIGHLTGDAARAQLAHLPQLAPSPLDDAARLAGWERAYDGDELWRRAVQEEYRGWLEEAARTGRAVVTFMY